MNNCSPSIWCKTSRLTCYCIYLCTLMIPWVWSDLRATRPNFYLHHIKEKIKPKNGQAGLLLISVQSSESNSQRLNSKKEQSSQCTTTTTTKFTNWERQLVALNQGPKDNGYKWSVNWRTDIWPQTDQISVTPAQFKILTKEKPLLVYKGL